MNNREGLQATEGSISCQNSQEYEWVVVDGGSRDGSMEVVRNSGIGCIECISEPDRGIYDAMNKGIKMSSGSHVLFLNSGDRLSDETVIGELGQLIGPLLEKNVRPVVAGGVNLILASKSKIYKAPRSASYIWHSTPGYHQATLFPRNFLTNNPYDTSYEICGDYYIGALAHARGLEFVLHDQPISDFEVGGFSYQHPFKQVREAMKVQKTILQLGKVERFISAVRRMINIFGTRALSAGASLVARLKV